MRWLLHGFLFAPTVLCGCGTSLPIMDIERPRDREFSQFVQGIVRHVKCELGQAVLVEYNRESPYSGSIKSWAAKIELTIRAMERGDFNPGISIYNISQTITNSFGGQFRSDSTREMVMTYFITFEELLESEYYFDDTPQSASMGLRPLRPCARSKPSRTPENMEPLPYTDSIAGNLGIHLTLKSAMESWTSMYGLSNRIEKGPFDTITHHVTFETSATGGLSPVYKFTNVSSNSSPLLSGSRVHRDELLITMGPLALGSRKVIPSKTLEDNFFVNQLRTSLRNR